MAAAICNTCVWRNNLWEKSVFGLGRAIFQAAFIAYKNNGRRHTSKTVLYWHSCQFKSWKNKNKNSDHLCIDLVPGGIHICSSESVEAVWAKHFIWNGPHHAIFTTGPSKEHCPTRSCWSPVGEARKIEQQVCENMLSGMQVSVSFNDLSWALQALFVQIPYSHRHRHKCSKENPVQNESYLDGYRLED